jgi:dethiobiotin synthase
LRYWKPIQTGTSVDDDTHTVEALTKLDRATFFDRGIRLPDPLSPHVAARRQSERLALEPLLDLAGSQSSDTRWIVEGAGGVLVPINESELMVDLMKRLALPALVVARTTLGTINHTLLTLEALRTRDVPVAGVVMNGVPDADNRWSIETYGRVSVVGEMPLLDPWGPDSLARHARAVDPDARLANLLQ